MSTLKSLTVISSTLTSKSNFCNKLQAKTSNTVETPFGNSTTEHQETYYLFTDRVNTVGTTGVLDLEHFTLREKPFNIAKEDGTMETIQLKYLYPKQ